MVLSSFLLQPCDKIEQFLVTPLLEQMYSFCNSIVATLALNVPNSALAGVLLCFQV